MKCLIFLSALLLVAAAVDPSETLIGWKDFHLTINNDKDAKLIRNYVEKNDYLLASENYKTYPEDVLVRPEQAKDFEALLRKKRIQYTVESDDIGSLIAKEKKSNKLAEDKAKREARSGEAFDASTYFAQHSQVNAWIDSLATANPTLVRVQSIGSSYGRRNIKVLRISTGAGRKIVFLDAAIHAREWLAPATLNWIIKQFINDYKNNDAAARGILNKYDLVFLPIVNPDGYDYTFGSSTTRFWRKTRQPYGSYYGADPNRNFDDNFGGPGTSNSPSSDVYHGPRPFSEPETKAMSDYLTTLRSSLALYISFHTYGQLWLTPPGYSRVNPPDHAEVMRVANAGANALKAVNGNTWKVGQPYNVGLYEAAGGSYDWVRNKLGVKYSYTLELKPMWPAGINGFLANVADITPSGREVYAAVKATINAVP